MRIIVDALGLPAVGGARNSALGWLRALAAQGAENEYIVYVSRREEVLAAYPNVTQRVISIGNRFAVRLWAQAQLPPAVRRERADLLHFTKNLGVVGAPCPTVVTVNDLTHLILADQYPAIDSAYWRYIQPWLLRRADGIIAISESVKRDLLHWYDLDESRITVIYPACASHFHTRHSPEALSALRERHGLRDRLLLYAGGYGVHKNVKTLIHAMAHLATHIPHDLVLVGGYHHTTSDHHLEDLAEQLGVADRVRFLGIVSDEDLAMLYQAADLFVSASLNEGFGLVFLESMISGTPVVAAARGAAAEVVGEAGRFVDDALDSVTFSSAILDVLSCPQTLAQLKEKSLSQSRLYSWEKTAAATLNLYRQLVGDGS